MSILMYQCLFQIKNEFNQVDLFDELTTTLRLTVKTSVKSLYITNLAVLVLW